MSRFQLFLPEINSLKGWRVGRTSQSFDLALLLCDMISGGCVWVVTAYNRYLTCYISKVTCFCCNFVIYRPLFENEVVAF
jgi:hypothetical protein